MKFYLSTVIVSLVLILFSSLSAEALTYSELESLLDRGQIPAEEQVEALPAPETARQYYLISRVKPDFNDALKYLEAAVEEAEEQRSEYLYRWVELVNLRGLQEGELDFLADRLDEVDRDKTEGGLWLKSGRLAREKNENSRAQEWFELAKQFPESEPEACLELAELALEREKIKEAENLLQEYFINFKNGNRPRFWLLQGQFFEEQGADSEAYVTYSHVIQNYPDSLLLPVAEDKIASLRLPEELVAGVDKEEISAEELIEAEEDPDPAVEVGPYWVQVGSFQEKSRAENLQLRVERQFDSTVEIRPATVEGQTYYRVQVGGFNTREDAREKESELEAAGIDGWIISR